MYFYDPFFFDLLQPKKMRYAKAMSRAGLSFVFDKQEFTTLPKNEFVRQYVNSIPTPSEALRFQHGVKLQKLLIYVATQHGFAFPDRMPEDSHDYARLCASNPTTVAAWFVAAKACGVSKKSIDFAIFCVAISQDHLYMCFLFQLGESGLQGYYERIFHFMQYCASTNRFPSVTFSRVVDHLKISVLPVFKKSIQIERVAARKLKTDLLPPLADIQALYHSASRQLELNASLAYFEDAQAGNLNLRQGAGLINTTARKHFLDFRR